MAVPRISKEDLKQQLDGGASPVLVDARLKYPYEHSTVRLPGAIRYSGDGPVPSLPRDRDVVVYDSDPNELASSHVAAMLIRQGYRAATLKGGIAEWLAANLPTEAKEAPRQAAMRRDRQASRLAVRRFPRAALCSSQRRVRPAAVSCRASAHGNQSPGCRPA